MKMTKKMAADVLGLSPSAKALQKVSDGYRRDFARKRPIAPCDVGEAPCAVPYTEIVSTSSAPPAHATVLPRGWEAACRAVVRHAAQDDALPTHHRLIFEGRRLWATDGHRAASWPFVEVTRARHRFEVVPMNFGALPYAANREPYVWIEEASDTAAPRLVFQRGRFRASSPLLFDSVGVGTRLEPALESTSRHQARVVGVVCRDLLDDLLAELRGTSALSVRLTLSRSYESSVLLETRFGEWKATARVFAGWVELPKGLDRLSIGLNPTYFADAARSLGTDRVTLEVDCSLMSNTTTAPVFFGPGGERSVDRTAGFAVVMPLRLDD